jgi:hypothetical protein
VSSVAERIILDDTTVATGRSQLDITDWVDVEGIDWGEAVTTTYSAAAERGDIPVDYRVPNRQITIPLNLIERGGTTFATIRDRIQAKAGLWQAEGGWIARVPPSGGTVYADVTNASLRLSGAWEQAHKSRDLEAVLTLEAKPDFYKGEVTLGDHTETSAAELIFTETGIDGHYPGRVRVVVDEDDAETQRGLIWGLRSRHYSSATTARLQYEAEALTPISPTAATALTGASGGTVLQNASLGTDWTPIMNTNLLAGTYLTHTGSYRVWARVHDPGVSVGPQVKIRLIWDVGDLVNPVINAPWTFPQRGNFYVADLGEIRLDQSTVGTHRWQGQIQAKCDLFGADVNIDKIWFQPLDEGAGVLRVPLNLVEGTVVTSALSSFDTEAGAITGDSLTTGGTWAGAGDADDFSAAASVATRTAVSDAGTTAGPRLMTASTPTLTGTLVQVDVKVNSVTAAGASDGPGVLARYASTNAYLFANLNFNGPSTLSVMKAVAGTHTQIGYAEVTPALAADTFYTIRLWVTADGAWTVWVYEAGTTPGAPAAAGIDSVLATGGTLASGKVGVMDWHTSASAQTRTIDNFYADAGPSPDAVIHASQSLQLTTEGMFREDSGGAAYGPVSWVEGDLPRIPPAHPEARTVEVFLKASRGDLGDLPDSGIDDISARMTYRPCSLYVPEP